MGTAELYFLLLLIVFSIYILQKRILFATILNMQKKRPARQGEALAFAPSASDRLPAAVSAEPPPAPSGSVRPLPAPGS